MEESLLSPEYIAGLFDGEGWFSISKGKGTRYSRIFQYQAKIGMLIRQREVLEIIREKYGGTIIKTKKVSEKHNDYFLWRVGDKKLIPFLKDIGPFLIIKRPQYLIVNSFVNYKSSRGFKKLSDQEYEYYIWCFNELKRLNHRGAV